MKDTIEVAREMEFMANDCVAKSRGMSETMERGLPEWGKEEQAQQHGMSATRDLGGDAGNDEELLQQYDSDIVEVNEWTDAICGTNLFTVVAKGKDAFGGLVGKVDICEHLFGKSKDLCTRVASLSQIVGADANCCAYVQAVDLVKDMLKVIDLSQLVTKLAEIARRLVEAVVDLMKAAWSKFSLFSGDFQAA